MLTVVWIFGLLAFLFTVAISIEVAYPSSRVVNVIKGWQTGIGIAVGFLGLALTQQANTIRWHFRRKVA